MGNGVTSIGASAFSRCNSLTDVTLSSNLKSIGSYAFGECSSLTSLTLPDGLETIQSDAFKQSGLTSLTIPDSVTGAEQGWVDMCYGLKSLTIGNGVTAITSLTSCTALEELNLGNSIKSIRSGVLQNCKLTKIVIPDSMEGDLSYVLVNCSTLKEITLGSGINKLSNGSLGGCSSIEKLYIKNKDITIGSANLSSTNLTDIYFAGTKAYWDGMIKDTEQNDGGKSATLHENYTAW